MPNWCYNRAVITAKTEEELTAFLDFAGQAHESRWKDSDGEIEITQHNGVFWNFVTPTDTETYFEGGNAYHWNLEHWETKWDIELDRDDIEIVKGNDDFSLVWNFETAWSPALPVYQAMAERFPNLDFNIELEEESNSYAGKLHYRGSEVFDENIISDPTHADFEELDIPCVRCGWENDGDCQNNTEKDEEN